MTTDPAVTMTYFHGKGFSDDGFDSCRSSVPGSVWVEIARIGMTRNPIVMVIATKLRREAVSSSLLALGSSFRAACEALLARDAISGCSPKYGAGTRTA
jgi:hypothetical protein